MRRSAPAGAVVALALVVLAGACDDDDGGGVAQPSPTTALASTSALPSTTAATAPPTTTLAPTSTAPATTPPATTAPATTAPVTTTVPPTTLVPPRPDWLGQRPLPLRPDGYGEVQPTPPELVDRQLATVDHLPPPPDDTYVATVADVPADVLARSTWHPGCPVAAEELRYLTVAFWGFDGRTHTGELLVHESAADDLVEVFGRLHRARFPIEEMRVVSAADLLAPPTGDGNNTSGFSCRNATMRNTWSVHASGLAIDVNPFHNPYVRGDFVLPELASAYVDRTNLRPGMIQRDDVVFEAFSAIGWGWGGDFNGLRDDMHFSVNGR